MGCPLTATQGLWHVCTVYPHLHTCIYTILKRLKCDREGSLIACAISNEVDYTTRMKTRNGEAAGHPDGTIKHT